MSLAEATTRELMTELERRLQVHSDSTSKKIYMFIKVGYDFLPRHILSYRRMQP